MNNKINELIPPNFFELVETNNPPEIKVNKDVLKSYLDAGFFPSPVTVNPITREPKFENNVSENNILLNETLEGLLKMHNDNIIDMAEYRTYLTKLKNNFEINKFANEQLVDLLCPNKFEQVLHGSDNEDIINKNTQIYILLESKLTEMQTIGFIDKKTYYNAQNLLIKNYAASDKRIYNSNLN